MAGIMAGIAVGIVNGTGVAFFGVSPFIMTLGISSAGFGIALFMTGGTPVYGTADRRPLGRKIGEVGYRPT